MNAGCDHIYLACAIEFSCVPDIRYADVNDIRLLGFLLQLNPVQFWFIGFCQSCNDCVCVCVCADDSCRSTSPTEKRRRLKHFMDRFPRVHLNAHTTSFLLTQLLFCIFSLQRYQKSMSFHSMSELGVRIQQARAFQLKNIFRIFSSSSFLSVTNMSVPPPTKKKHCFWAHQNQHYCTFFIHMVHVSFR